MRDYLTIEVKGVEKKLRPNLTAIQAIETNMGMTLGQLVTATQASPDIKLMIETLYQGFIAGDNKVSREEIMELLEEEGLPEMQLIVASFFSIGTAGKKFREASIKTVDGLVAALREARLQKLNEMQAQLDQVTKSE